MAKISDPDEWGTNKFPISDRQREFLNSVLDKKQEPYHSYHGYIKKLLKQGHYKESSKELLNRFGYDYIEKYFTITEAILTDGDIHYRNIKQNVLYIRTKKIINE